jgi:hypothetical protein
MTSPLQWGVRLASGALLSVGALVLLVSFGATARAQPRAHASHALRATDKAAVHYIQTKSEGSYLYEEGGANGTLPGFMRANCDVGATFTATFTIYTRSGEIKGHAVALMHGSGRYESFAGTMTATGGTHTYVHAHGHGGFYGVLDRRTYDMTIQTTGTLAY